MTVRDDDRSCMYVIDGEVVPVLGPKTGESLHDVPTSYVVRAISRIRSSRKVQAALAALSLHVTEAGESVRDGWPFARPLPAPDDLGQFLVDTFGSPLRFLSWLAVLAAAAVIAALTHLAVS